MHLSRQRQETTSAPSWPLWFQDRWLLGCHVFIRMLARSQTFRRFLRNWARMPSKQTAALCVGLFLAASLAGCAQHGAAACPDFKGFAVRTEDGHIFTLASGELHQIPDPETLVAQGFTPNQEIAISDDCLRSMTIGTPIASVRRDSPRNAQEPPPRSGEPPAGFGQIDAPPAASGLVGIWTPKYLSGYLDAGIQASLHQEDFIEFTRSGTYITTQWHDTNPPQAGTSSGTYEILSGDRVNLVDRSGNTKLVNISVNGSEMTIKESSVVTTLVRSEDTNGPTGYKSTLTGIWTIKWRIKPVTNCTQMELKPGGQASLVCDGKTSTGTWDVRGGELRMEKTSLHGGFLGSVSPNEVFFSSTSAPYSLTRTPLASLPPSTLGGSEVGRPSDLAAAIAAAPKDPVGAESPPEPTGAGPSVEGLVLAAVDHANTAWSEARWTLDPASLQAGVAGKELADDIAELEAQRRQG